MLPLPVWRIFLKRLNKTIFHTLLTPRFKTQWTKTFKVNIRSKHEDGQHYSRQSWYRTWRPRRHQYQRPRPTEPRWPRCGRTSTSGCTRGRTNYTGFQGGAKQNTGIFRSKRQRQHYGDRIHQKDRGFGPHKLLDWRNNVRKCGQQSQGLRLRLALRNSRNVGLDSGSVNMDKFEAPISETEPPRPTRKW